MAKDIANFSVRYDGLDAAEHRIELNDFSQSLHGLTRIISVAAHFSETLKYVKHTPSLDVKVYAGVPREKCFELWLYIQSVAQTPLFEGSGGLLLVSVLNYIVGKWSAKDQEMDALKESLKFAIDKIGQNDAATIERLFGIVERMTEDLRPALKQTVKPVGRSADTISFGWSAQAPIVDVEKRRAIDGPGETELQQPKVFVIYISEADLNSKHCKISFDETDGARFSGIILDPLFQGTADPYTGAMHNRHALKVLAKAEISQDGEMVKLHILTLV